MDPIFISTSNSVFAVRDIEEGPRPLMRRKTAFWPFRRGSRGFFGIAPGECNCIFVASRERLGTPRAGKPSTDMILHEIDGAAGTDRKLAVIRDVHDVHQIARAGNLIFITDTGKNRVRVFDTLTLKIRATINVGAERSDINHINAVEIHGDRLLIGLNNRGHTESEIASCPLDSVVHLGGADVSLPDVAEIQKLNGLYHTHDLVPFRGDLLVCSSHEGKIHRAGDGRMLAHPGEWVRGLAVSGDRVWVGASALADRSKRHREDLDGEVHVYDADTWKRIRSYRLSGAGQVNDITTAGT